MQDTGRDAEQTRRILDRMVLETVSQDYVPIELMVRTLENRNIGTRESIRSCLLTLLARQQVGAYLLHAESPFYTAVSATEDTLDRYWFFITDQGDQLLQSTKGNEKAPSQMT